MGKVRLLFIDRNVSTRALFSYVLEGASGLEIVGEAADHQTAIELARKCNPDAVVVGYELPPWEDAELRSCLQAEFPETQIIELWELDDAVSEKLGRTPVEYACSRMIH